MRKGKLFFGAFCCLMFFLHSLQCFALGTGSGTVDVQYEPTINSDCLQNSKDKINSSEGTFGTNKKNTPDKYEYVDLTKSDGETFSPNTYPRTNSNQNYFLIFDGFLFIGLTRVFYSYCQRKGKQNEKNCFLVVTWNDCGTKHFCELYRSLCS